MFKVFTFVCCFFSSLAQSQSASTSQQDKISWYQFTFENDVMSARNSSDDGYSNGMSYAWGALGYNAFSSIEMPDWIRFLSDWTYINQDTEKQYSIAYGISQSIYTPSELSQITLIEDDRPYAGTLLWHSKIRSYADNRANSLGLILGVAGPASFAEQSQTIIHEIIDATTPEGWDNQINNELVFRVEAEHIERFYIYSFSENISFDTSSYSELGVGNLRSDIGTGLTVRIGNMLDQSYASISANTSRLISGLSAHSNNTFYWQLFTSVYASYLFNDITLNGNTFSDSHSVELIHEQVIASMGVSALYHHWGFVFSVLRGNKQFEGQENVSKYGSFTISYQY
ncbi:lipid A deacylase LpxR family protein [Psychromonas hadalis]|uniref:lipid A deacylase LpxR family protein n=1 Tax=Psychromonas hadalis TaxID=211669 RepID=UPI0003B5B846|nr:lipid A deacylase LpxR family protein [Psychromonas hadalis]